MAQSFGSVRSSVGASLCRLLRIERDLFCGYRATVRDTARKFWLPGTGMYLGRGPFLWVSYGSVRCLPMGGGLLKLGIGVLTSVFHC